jgi:hypothetical protein
MAVAAAAVGRAEAAVELHHSFATFALNSMPIRLPAVAVRALHPQPILITLQFAIRFPMLALGHQHLQQHLIRSAGVAID